MLTGPRPAFSAGGDFAWFPELRDLERLDALRHDARQLITDLLDVELPIVAAVNGPAIGLGASIALLCDVILMADTRAPSPIRTCRSGSSPATAAPSSGPSRWARRGPSSTC